MSLYDGIPETFPLDVNVGRRPVSFVLQTAASEKFLIVVMTAFWLVFLPFIIMLPVIDAEPDAPPSDAMYYGLASIAAVAVLAAVRFWAWKNFCSVFSRVEVTVSEDRVNVERRTLIGVEKWSEPILAFSGIGIENRGTQTVQSGKIPVSAVLLVHPDASRSVPLMIAGALKVTRSKASGKAKQLGLPLIDGVITESAQAYPPGTIVENSWQSLKVRLLYAALAFCSAAFACITIYQFATGTPEPAFAILWLLSALAFAAMHAFARSYVVSMGRAADAEDIRVTTAAIFTRAISFKIADVQSTTYVEGKSSGSDLGQIHAPWVKLRIKGRSRLLVVDMQSDYVDESWFMTFERGG